MTDPRSIATRLLGAIECQTEVSGLCRCPGEAVHTHKTGKEDCGVNVDGAPSVYCYDSSSSKAVAEANRRLHRELGASPWEIRLSGGAVLRSGDILKPSGLVLKREEISETQWNASLPDERVGLENVRSMAERFRPELFEVFHWPMAQIAEDSPRHVCERDAEDQFRTWLKLWPAHCHVWIGDVFSSGRPEHRTHFRPIANWSQIGLAMGNYTCGSSFKPGSYSRSKANLNGQRLLVVESDRLAKDDVGAVISCLRRRLHYRLHCIAVDLGAIPPPLPEMVTLRQFAAALPQAPPQIIEGIQHQGCKMILGGHRQVEQVVVPA